MTSKMITDFLGPLIGVKHKCSDPAVIGDIGDGALAVEQQARCGTLHSQAPDEGVEGLPCERAEDTVEVVGRETRHAGQFLEGEFLAQVGVDVIDDAVDTRHVLFTLPAL